MGDTEKRDRIADWAKNRLSALPTYSILLCELQWEIQKKEPVSLIGHKIGCRHCRLIAYYYVNCNGCGHSIIYMYRIRQNTVALHSSKGVF